MEKDKEPTAQFSFYPIGFFLIDIAEAQLAEGKLYLYAAIDRMRKFAYAQVARDTGRISASAPR